MIYINSLPKNINDISHDVIVGDDYVEKAPSLYPKEAEINIKINDKKMANKRAKILKKNKYIKRKIQSKLNNDIHGRQIRRLIERIIKFSIYTEYYLNKIKPNRNTDLLMPRNVNDDIEGWKRALEHLRIKYLKDFRKFYFCKNTKLFIYKWFVFNLVAIVTWSFKLCDINSYNCFILLQLENMRRLNR